MYKIIVKMKIMIKMRKINNNHKMLIKIKNKKIKISLRRS